ncbi:MAG: murein L,D-transpeptidase catalytic domain family protein [Bacteroidota bacterium]
MKVNILQHIRMMITCLMFIQMPILIAGNNAVPATTLISHINHSLYPTNSFSDLYECMELEEKGLSKDAFEKAIEGYQELLNSQKLKRIDIITIADFSKPSNEERLFVIDLKNNKILHKTLVAHGKNSGLLYARDFSNKPETNKSSLGFYLTLNSYSGEHGFSLRLKGLEKNINDKAFERAIVMHGAPYVSQKNVRQNGFIGRSLGCPAIPMAKAGPIIQSIKNGTLLFIYHPSKQYINQSAII